MKTAAWAVFLALGLGLTCPLGASLGGSGLSPALLTGKNVEDPVIPADAQGKAILALKALGADRGAKSISYHASTILGVSRGLGFDSKQVEKNLKELRAKETKLAIQIDLPGDVLFDFDRWAIRPEAEATMKKVGEIIRATRSPEVLISGHSDSKGEGDYNRKLSLKRAESVRDWLAKKAGVDAGVMKTEGLGEAKPVAPNVHPDGSDNPDGRQKNRRVEIVIKKL